MGCDIHLYREERGADGVWVSLDEWEGECGDGLDVPFQKRFTDRNYNLFAILAGVREREAPPYKFEPRGLPPVMSKEVAAIADPGSGDHSHSYLYRHELEELKAALAVATYKISGMKGRDEIGVLQRSIESGSPNWDLIYPYCEWTNAPNYARFEVDVPANFIVGDGLDRIIASLTGPQSRIVFWFDS